MPAAIISMHSIQFHWRQWNWAAFSRTNRNSSFPNPGDTCTLLKRVMLFGLVWSSFYLTLASSKDTNLPPEKPKGCVTKSTSGEIESHTVLHAAQEPWEDQWDAPKGLCLLPLSDFCGDSDTHLERWHLIFKLLTTEVSGWNSATCWTANILTGAHPTSHYDWGWWRENKTTMGMATNQECLRYLISECLMLCFPPTFPTRAMPLYQLVSAKRGEDTEKGE